MALDLSCIMAPQTRHRTQCEVAPEQSVAVTFLQLARVLCLMHPRTLLALLVARMHG